jgi:peptidylprolyl isomerase
MLIRRLALAALTAGLVSVTACGKSEFAAPPSDAQVTASGLASKVVKPGTGTEHPTALSQVTVNYTGWTTDGKQFDSNVGKDPVTFPLNGVIPGWTEGVQLMVAGEKRRFWIPGKIAYGDTPDPNNPGAPKGLLTFDIELLSFTTPPPPPPPPPVPDDVAAPPASAQKTKSGLASRVLTPGTGNVHPKAASTVTVHYSGWTTDGKMFDSSAVRNTPATFPLTGVIPGWTEGVQLMVVGEKRRFWIPGALAYDNIPRPGAPKGMLVFDIELLDIK